MWIFLWIVISSIILGIFGWSQWILIQQKRAWKILANKYKLEYKPRKFTESAVVTGKFQGYRLNLFSDAYRTGDARGERYVTVIEIEICKGMPTGAAMGTESVREFVDQLSFRQSFVPEHEKWRDEYILRTRDVQLTVDYLTRPRLDALTSLFAMKNATILFFFDEMDSILHIETLDPLRDPARLERIIMRLIQTARVLDIAPDKKKGGATPTPPASETPDELSS